MSPQAKKAKQSIYGVHPGVAMVQKWISELKERTGRSLQEWIALVRKKGPDSEKERSEWLRTKHKLGTNSAWWIAERAGGRGGEEDSPEKYLAIAPKYVAQQYSGKKEVLRPIYEQLLQIAAELGADVKACPCLTMVPLYRNHVFAQIKATTNTLTRSGAGTITLNHTSGALGLNAFGLNTAGSSSSHTPQRAASLSAASRMPLTARRAASLADSIVAMSVCVRT